MKHSILACFGLSSILILSGCGTIKSFKIDNNAVEIKHPLVKTNCDEISNIYSGIRYDLCLLDSTRKNKEIGFIDPLYLITIDMLFSGVADTVVLPYTYYQQRRNGNLKVKK